MPVRRTYYVLIGSVLVAFALLTAFHVHEHRRLVREVIRDHELPSIGLAVEASFDRTSADYKRVTERLLRDNFIRNWILDGERDHDALYEFMDAIRHDFDMIEVGIVSDRSEIYYGPDGRTFQLSPENDERDSWYYAYRASRPKNGIDIWYYPETDTLEMWVNVSILDEDEMSAFHEAYREADRALYKAKRTGRNRVCVASDESSA